MTPATLPTLRDLEGHVLRQLCTRDNLDPRWTPLHSRVLYKNGRPCGMFFHVQGPRLLRAYAVWSADEGRVLFYDGLGHRFAETPLAEAPSLTEEGSAAAA